jgi:hypothetical protein
MQDIENLQLQTINFRHISNLNYSSLNMQRSGCNFIAIFKIVIPDFQFAKQENVRKNGICASSERATR